MHLARNVFQLFRRTLPYSRTVLFLAVIVFSCKEGKNQDPQPQPEETEFKNPVLTGSPDPWVFQKDDQYYLTHTTGNSLKLYRTSKMSELSKATSKTVWTAPASGMNSRNIWAPELHFVEDKWYFYYAADDGDNANHRMWVLENASVDPLQGTWVDKGELELPDDKWAIDGTIFSHNDQLYFLWSGWEGDTDVRQDIYIVKMTDPFTAEGERVLLSKPELGWELNGSPPGVNEGPQFLRHDDKVFIVYSASGCWTDDYALGMLTADASADLLDPGSWTKSSEPVFKKYPDGQVYGPGHNGFFMSADGTENWIIYHANAFSGQGCGNNRSVRMQPFTWTTAGLPDFGRPAALDVSLDKPSGE
jgi:GH43 family beta-xylosidase